MLALYSFFVNRLKCKESGDNFIIPEIKLPLIDAATDLIHYYMENVPNHKLFVHSVWYHIG